MNKSRLVLLGSVVAGVLCVAAATAQVNLLEADTRVFAQANGVVDVTYRLTFRELEGRTHIREAGEFYQPMVVNHVWIWDGENQTEGSAVWVRGGYYRIDFGGLRTVKGKDYRVEINYRSTGTSHVSPTRRNDRDMLVVSFNPIKWSLPIEKSVITMVLPVTIDSALVERQRDVTQDVVDAMGVVTDVRNMPVHDAWAYTATEVNGEQRLTIRCEKRRMAAQDVHSIVVFFPSDTIRLPAR